MKRRHLQRKAGAARGRQTGAVQGDTQRIELAPAPISQAAQRAHACDGEWDEDVEQKWVELDLRENEEKYRALYDNAPLSYQSLDANGCFVDVNPAWLRTMGYTRDEVIGRCFADFLHPDWRPHFETHFPAFKERGYIRGVDFKLRHKNGHYLDVGFEGRIGYLPDGSFRQTYCVFQDLTALREAEAERERLLAQVRDQAHQMEHILATVPAGVLLLDGDGRVLQANPVAEDQLAALLDGGVPDLLTHLGDQPLTHLLTAPPTPGLWHEVKANANAFEVIARPVADGGAPEHWVLVIREVTQDRERERRAQQHERLAAVGMLAAGIAHDFNNLMAVIVLYTRMALSAPDLAAVTRDRLEIVSQQARRATTLIQQILDFSRRSVLERRLMDLVPLLQEVVDLVGRTIPENIQCSVSYGGDEYISNVDPTRIEQAILNLALNARDAMAEGGALSIELSRVSSGETFRCATCGEVAGGAWIRIAVRDTGCGIPPDVLPFIFEPFFTTKEVGKGTGLGLPQVYGIVKQHAGHVEVCTAVGQGTTVALYLPALEVARSVSPTCASLPTLQGQGETILVVEDDVVLRDALVDSITSLNYRVLAAAHGRDALQVLAHHSGTIALVLSDLVMPEMGGQALFAAMRQRGFTMPVVMLTGHPREQELAVLETQGVAGWLLKPPDMAQLSGLLARALGKDSW